MSPLLAPLLAQVVSLQLGDRTEARYVDFDGGKRWEGSTSPVIGLGVSSRRTNFQVIYGPGISVSPLNDRPRQWYVFHQLGTSVGYALRRTTFGLSSSLGIGSLNFKLAGLQPPSGAAVTPSMPGTGTPTGDSASNGTANNGTATNGTASNGTATNGTGASGMPTSGTPTNGMAPNGTPTTPGGAITTARDQKVRFYVWNTTLNVGHRLTRRLQLAAIAGSSTAGALDDASRPLFPTVRGWTLGGSGSYVYVISKQDGVNGLAALTKTWSSNDNEAATLTASATWGHRFSPRTSGALGGGLFITRFTQANGLAGFSVFPAFTAGATHQVPVGRGGLSFSLTAFSSPALDPLRATVDPRVGLTGVIGYTQKKLFASVTGTTALSVAPSDNDASAVNYAQADARVGYFIARVVSVDTGARISHQTYGGQNVVPTSWAAFVGLNIVYSTILMHGR